MIFAIVYSMLILICGRVSISAFFVSNEKNNKMKINKIDIYKNYMTYIR